MENRCIIVSGGVFSPAPEQQPGDFVIACDRGYAYCGRLGLMPDLFIGDFDSYSGAVAPGVAVERLIPEKDDTDTMHAVRRALELGFTSLGFSEHADTEIPVDWNAYIAEIDRLKAACGDRLRIRTGIELLSR